jgi:hypothetical protein
MKQSEHHPKDLRTFNKGATRDIDPELSGAENKGVYFDSENGRVSSDKGKEGAWEKIRGEEEYHDPGLPGGGDWFCLCDIPVNKDQFEIWVDKNGVEDPHIVVNGIIMGTSVNMPWLYEHRMQWDTNESCVGGEVFLTDFNTAPTIFNVGNIIENYNNGSSKYFGDFNLNAYTINLQYSLDSPVFVGLVNVGGGGGLEPGSYQYSYRYINDAGDATNWTPLTPPIPVIRKFSADSPQYPYCKTFGDESGTGVTNFGIKLKFRVTNLNDYNFIQLRRIAYNQGLNIEVVPAGVIIAEIDIEPGEISIKEYIDPTNNNIDEEVLAEDEEAGQPATIERAKAIRYYDKRLVLMNIEKTSKDFGDTSLIEYNGEKIFPIVEKLGKIGFKSPVNHTYKKNYMSGEKFSFGINVFDGYGGTGFTFEDDALKNVQAPNRRDPLTGNSLALSPEHVVAADVNSNVGPTFEMFDHEDAVTKTDLCSFQNIMEKGSRGANSVDEFCAHVDDWGNTVKASEIGYRPLEPVNEDDDNVSDHNYRINPRVSKTDGEYIDYNPRGFGLNYYTKGFAIGGVQNLPPWARAFSVVRKGPASLEGNATRVACQGIGTFYFEEGDIDNFTPFTSCTKALNKIVFSTFNNIPLGQLLENPENFKIQFISPLGYFSEVYNFRNKDADKNRDSNIDMIVYARILKDLGQINPGEQPSMGINGNVAYNRYRNNANVAGGDAFNVPEGGNKLFGISSVGNPGGFSGISGGTHLIPGFEITLDQNVYTEPGSQTNPDFDGADGKQWNEPFYIVNIVQTGVDVDDFDVNEYRGIGHYQKLESVIGRGGGPASTYPLVDERWEDCVPDLSPTGPNAGLETFVYLVNNNGDERPCVNVTYMTPAQVSTILSDISANGFWLAGNGTQVQGIYTHSIANDGTISIVFDATYTAVSGDELVVVRYDETRPIRFFGGDTFVSEAIAPILHEEVSGNQDSDNQKPFGGQGFIFGRGMPFRRHYVNPRYYVIKHTTGWNKIQDEHECRLGFIRQMAVMWVEECRNPINFAFSKDEIELVFVGTGLNVGGAPGCFPSTHYSMRPIDFKEGVDEDDDDNVYDQYYDDYAGKDWGWGGFGFTQKINRDYIVRGPILYFSKPKLGFTEENYFCTGIVWSLPRSINQQNSPGLKTFPSDNIYFLDDDNGEIKKAWDARTDGKGDNLYAITESGIALLLTQKAILSNISADDLTVTANDEFISDKYWISKEIGSDAEFWRGMAEESVEIPTETGLIEREVLFIPNRHSVYRLMDNVVRDVLKGSYYTRVHPSLQDIGPGYQSHMAGFFDKNHNEYWLQIDDIGINNQNKAQEFREVRCFVYSQDTGYWIGRFHYDFDKYSYQDSVVYGVRDGLKFELEKGFIINGEPIPARLIGHTSRSIQDEKEFVDFSANTGPRGTMKPTAVRFLDEEFNQLCVLDEATYGPRYLKQHDGWYNLIPRKDAIVSATRDRIQYRLILFEIIHTFEEDFKVVSAVIQFKPIN